MKNLPRPHQRYTPAQREGILQSYQESQLTQKEFAVQAGISVSALQAWLRKAVPGDAEPSGSRFVAVPNRLSGLPAAPAYCLRWPGGLALEVRAGFTAEELSVLLQLVQDLC